MARYHFGMHNDEKSRSEDLGIQVLYNDVMAVAFARRVIQNILHQNVNRYSDWSMDVAHDALPRSIYEGARDMARQIARSWEGRIARRLRKKVEMLFAHLKRILKLDRLRLRGPNGAHDEFLLAATAQNLRKMAKLIPAQKLKPA
jgi:DDE family transposase